MAAAAAAKSEAVGAAGNVYVWGSWITTATFAYIADPVYAMDFYGGVECFLEPVRARRVKRCSPIMVVRR